MKTVIEIKGTEIINPVPNILNDEIQIRLINHQNFQERSASLLLFCKKEEYQLVHFLHF